MGLWLYWKCLLICLSSWMWYWFCMGILVSIGFAYLWDFPGNDTGMGCHFLLQGIFPTERWNPGLPCLLPCWQVLYPRSIQGSLFYWKPQVNIRSEAGQPSCGWFWVSSWNYFSDILATGKSQMYFAPSTFTLILKKNICSVEINLISEHLITLNLTHSNSVYA